MVATSASPSPSGTNFPYTLISNIEKWYSSSLVHYWCGRSWYWRW